MPTAILFVSFANVILGAPADYDRLKTQAEARFADGSYALAHELYEQAKTQATSTSEREWVEFRLADTLWRAQAGSSTYDSSKYEEAYKRLTDLLATLDKGQGKSRILAEVLESLGDYQWLRRDSHNWWGAWQPYERALDYWAAASGDEARGRYLKIVMRAVLPPWRDSGYYYGYYGNTLPVAVCEKAIKLAVTDDEKAATSYVLARALRDQGGPPETGARAAEAYEAVLKIGKKSSWYDDALYEYAYMLETQGRASKPLFGDWKTEVDYVKALELYRRLRAELKGSETRYFDNAQERINEITRPVLSLSVGNIFLPDSELQLSLNWRNVKSIGLDVYSVDLASDLTSEALRKHGNWLESLDLSQAKRVQGWTKDTNDQGDYKPANDTVRLQGKLAVGAYIVTAKAGDLERRDFLLVSDATLLVKTSGRQALAYFANALDGSPIAKARVSLWYRDEDRDGALWIHGAAQTDNDGLASFSLERNVSSASLFLAANGDSRQALVTTSSYRQEQSGKSWRIYAYTDRPAYRPKETASWKLIARQWNGRDYSTPAGETLAFEIYDARGSKVSEGKTKLNAFGSAWGSLPLTEALVLGEYHLRIYTEGRRDFVGEATLFRLEEYKLPEFTVTVKTPETGGKPKAFKAGDKVEAEISVEYYFGGGVPNATVDVAVRQKPFWPSYSREREFPWLYSEAGGYGYYGGWGGYDLLSQSLRTDSGGKAKVTFEVPQLGEGNTEFAITARAVDSSRREVTGSGRVRISSKPYFIYAFTRHAVVAPKDHVAVDFKALDANDAPAQAEGTLTVTREVWTEIWLDPKGKEVTGEALRRLKQAAFPPTDGWKPKSFDYRSTEVKRERVKTNAQGELVFGMTAGDEGFYRIRFQGDDAKTPVTTEAAVYVATDKSQDVGFHAGGLDILLDRDDARPGETVRALLVAPTPGHWLLFDAEATDIYNYELVPMTGNTKLVELKVDARHAPNVFLVATLVSERQVQETRKELIVPPIKEYLEVEVKPDATTYEPHGKARFSVATHDAAGKPVAAEVSLGVVDDSVYAIQAEYAGDPRQTFWGDKRSAGIQLSSTFNQKGYVRLVKGDKGELIDAQSVIELRRRAALLRAPSRPSLGEDEVPTPAAPSDDREMEAAPASADMAMSKSAAGAAAPSAAPAQAAERKERAASKPGGGMKDKAGGPGGAPSAVQVRSDFRATAFWKPDVVTGDNGRATIEVQLPETLTSWRSTARAVGKAARFGVGTAKVRTQQPLMVRLQGPRFFVVGDKLMVSAIVNNYSDTSDEVSVELEASGLTIEGTYSGPQTSHGATRRLTLAAGAEARVDWRVSVPQAGDVLLKVTAKGESHGDAMERKLKAYEHGVDKMLARSGKLKGSEAKVTLDLPPRREGSTRMAVQVTPSLATAILDALPYLVAYPYGCTEQTMSRFLPTVIVRRAMKEVGLDPQTAMSRLALALKVRPAGKPAPDLKGDIAEIDAMIDAGLTRLYDFVHSDGGWGWWKGDESDRFMTAYVLWGLSLAAEAGVEVKTQFIDGGASYLRNVIAKDELDLDRQAWTLQALGKVYAARHGRSPADSETAAIDNLWKHRDLLNAYGRALFALALKDFGMPDRARLVLDNLENGAAWDKSPDASVLVKGSKPKGDAPTLGIVHWGADGAWWHWQDSPIEATSFALKAFLAIDKNHRLIDPAMNWLLKNRRGAEWTNTRDTALALLALTDYLKLTGEATEPLEFEVLVNGRLLVKKKVARKELLLAPSTFTVDPEWLKDGPNEVVIKKLKGQALYFFARADFFSLEEPITAAGHEIFVKRQYFKLADSSEGASGSPGAIAATAKTLLSDNGSITSGERVEVVMTIETKNDYEYLLFEDLKPAGFEATEVKSGESLYASELKSAAAEAKHGDAASADRKATSPAPYFNGELTGRTEWVYQELRDRKVALFLGRLPQGVWEVRYVLRAEVPGKFHALPVLGHAMYVPDVRANSDELRVEVKERN